MLRFIVVLCLAFFSLYGLSDHEILNRANTYMKSANKTDKFRAYNDYKNLYLRAIMSGDKKLKRDSLRGIVKSGKSLHIDVSQYADELKNSKPEKLYTVPKPKHQTKSNKKIKVKSLHKLQSISWTDDNGLILRFDKKMRSRYIKYVYYYSKYKKGYIYIFDISNSMLMQSHTLKHEALQSIRISQYKPNVVRLALVTKKKIKRVRYRTKNKELRISLSLPKKPIHNVPKTIYKNYKNKVIVIDAGHGGKDPGAIGYRHYREKIIVLQIAQKLRDRLRKRGYKVYMTRDKDHFIKLSHRTKYANKKRADLFISIHANAVSRHKNKAHGIETYFLSPSRSKRAEKIAAMENSADISEMNIYGKQSFLGVLNHYKILASNKLAIDLQRGMLGALNKKYKNVHDGGVREGPFWVLVGAQMPAVLIEVGFITHPREARRLVSSKYQSQLALGMANGIERYLMKN